MDLTPQSFPKRDLVAATCHGVHVPMSPYLNDTRIARMQAGRYEKDEIAGARAVVQPDDIVLELGAGLGVVGAVTARHAKPRKIFAFEANPDLLPFARALYALNGLQDVIASYNRVLLSGPNQPEQIVLNRPRSFLGSSIRSRRTDPARDVQVRTGDFDTVLRRSEATVAIMDIEGAELDLLRGTDFGKLRAVVIEFHPNIYGKDGMQACKALLREAGFRKVEDVSTRLVWTCTRAPVEMPPRALEPSPPSPHVGWSHSLRRVKNARIVPPEKRDFIQPCGVLDQAGRYVPEAALWRKSRPITTAPAIMPTSYDNLEGDWLWGGVLWSHFGHFITESTARLWALTETGTDLQGVVFTPKNPERGAAIRSFQKDFIRLLGFDGRIHCAAAPTRVESLHVPGQGFGLGAITQGTPQFRDMFQKRFAVDVAPDGPERLYISRSRLKGRGKLLGEAQIEDHLRAEGYSIFHPERYDLATQIAQYRAAKQIIGCDGSALHLLGLVARPDQQIAVINRRKSVATDLIDLHLRAFTGRHPLLINAVRAEFPLTSSDRKRLFAGQPEMRAIRDALAAQGFIKEQQHWSELTEAEVAAELSANAPGQVRPE